MLGQIVALWSVGFVLGIVMLSGVNCYTTDEELGIKYALPNIKIPEIPGQRNMDEEAPLMDDAMGMM